MEQPFASLRIVDFSTGIAGAYTTRLLADAGADVVKVEPGAGDPLRRWSASGQVPEGADGPLFEFLAGGKRAFAGNPLDPAVRELLAEADVVVESFTPSAFDAEAFCARYPRVVLLSLTPFGRKGPWRDRAWTEFTIQAASGSIATRGLPGAEPFQAGGRITEWFAGTIGAVAVLAALQRRGAEGPGEHIDLSLMEAMVVAGTNYMSVLWQMLGEPDLPGPAQSIETPSIEKTREGWVGFCTNSQQQFSDFLTLIGRPDLGADEELQQVRGRLARIDEWQAIVREHTAAHTTAEILEAAALLRIPSAPVNDGRAVLEHVHLKERGVFRRLPGTNALAPRPAVRFDDEDPPAPRPAPRLAETKPAWRSECRHAPRSGDCPLPLSGIRILDLTAWWAGPSATQILAAFGAEVIHVESTTRPDGMRMVGGMLAQRFDRWWEASAFFHAANTNKRGLALDLSQPRGQELARDLIRHCDALVENFTPRVLESFGLGWDVVHALNPQTILLRMPAFGLSGPWRDRPGFAQTMEQLSGLAWVTGHANDQPRIQRGPCDPLAGMHAAYAFFLALAERERRGCGMLVEATMVEAALAAASEIAIEWSAHGVLLGRQGNRSPGAAPQGLYACADGTPANPSWLALSVESDEHWQALLEALDWSPDSLPVAWAHSVGRKADENAIDERLRRVFAGLERREALARLEAAGVPAEALADPRRMDHHPQLKARHFFETIEHPVTGEARVPGQAFRFASRPGGWIERPAPTLGQHNGEVLGGLLGLSDQKIRELEDAGLIGTALSGI